MIWGAPWWQWAATVVFLVLLLVGAALGIVHWLEGELGPF